MEVFFIFLINFVMIALRSTIAGLVTYLLGWTFLVGFGIWFIADWLIGSLWAGLSHKLTSLKYTQIAKLEKIKSLREEVEVNCCYCGVRNNVKIQLGSENVFECNNCESKNKIQIDLSVMRTTTPISKDKVLQDIFSKIEG